MVLVNQYMVYVRQPFIGYRVLPAFAHLLPKCEGRPAEYSLSALYLFSGIEVGCVVQNFRAERRRRDVRHWEHFKKYLPDCILVPQSC